MPRKPIDYSKTIIYTLVCKDLSVKDLYVGHTTNWINRKSNHKYRCNTITDEGYNFKVYKMIREYGSWDNWEMVEIEKYPCNDEHEACTRERYWYEQLYASMNTQKQTRTKAEWREDNKEYLQEYEKNRPNLEERKEFQKQWVKDNKEVLSQKAKERYEKNKHIIAQKRKQKITCSCGSEVRKGHIKRHERTTKHKKYIEAVSVIQRVEEILNQDVNIP